MTQIPGVPLKNSPTLEQFKSGVPQEMRTRLSQIAGGYAQIQIDRLKNELHRGHHQRRDPRWSAYEVIRIPDGEGGFRERTHINPIKEEQLNKKLEKEIKLYETARTVMLDRLQAAADAAGVRSEPEFEEFAPLFWEETLQSVRAEHNPAIAEETETSVEEVEEAPVEDADEEPEMISVPVPQAAAYEDKPVSDLGAPKEPSLGDILGQIEEDNSDA